MQVRFERIIPLDDDDAQRVKETLLRLRFVHYIQGANGEIWGYAPRYIKERYETHFYLIDFSEKSFLIASTVPLKIPIPGRGVLSLEGSRKSVARRIRLHLMDPLNRNVKLQRTIGLNITSLLGLALLGGVLLWLNPYIFALTLLILILGLMPGNSKVAIRHGEKIMIFKRNKRAYRTASLLAGMIYLIPLIKTFQEIHRDIGDIRVFAAFLLVSSPIIILALMILCFQREWQDLV
ncbi:hypothetical protein E3E36_02315 [Thermococcus sp. M36]|uniref:hypothetical protein n=1 Tax=Thermococcus sp. M36 TaxID=1638261 RepID=UPI00143C6252|nr:hypothetical protein [Thermococcus sp. M36]NJE05000.1 hypothetical protein [Thermococcus sp. M36]